MSRGTGVPPVIWRSQARGPRHYPKVLDGIFPEELTEQRSF